MNNIIYTNEQYEIENLSIALYAIFDKIKERISIAEESNIYTIRDVGHNSESQVCKNTFNKLTQFFDSNILYIQDCEVLISYITECSLELSVIAQQFYEIIWSDLLITTPDKDFKGILVAKSPKTSLLFSLLSMLFIKMNSLFDYVTKISFELLKSNFPISKYKKLISKNKLYGNYKELVFSTTTDTIFENSNFINTVTSLRNHIIHHGYIDEHPKVYVEVENGIAFGRFVLFPDLNESGGLENCINRTLFYSKETKIDEKLPDLIKECQIKVINSLKVLIKDHEALEDSRKTGGTLAAEH